VALFNIRRTSDDKNLHAMNKFAEIMMAKRAF